MRSSRGLRALPPPPAPKARQVASPDWPAPSYLWLRAPLPREAKAVLVSSLASFNHSSAPSRSARLLLLLPARALRQAQVGGLVPMLRARALPPAPDRPFPSRHLSSSDCRYRGPGRCEQDLSAQNKAAILKLLAQSRGSCQHLAPRGWGLCIPRTDPARETTPRTATPSHAL